jgi:hypothetical protein
MFFLPSFDMWKEEGKGMIFFFKFCFFIVEWLGTRGSRGFFFNMLKGDGREIFFYVEKG